MTIADKEIIEFQKLFKEEFGKKLDYETAKKYCTDFLEFMVLFFKPKDKLFQLL